MATKKLFMCMICDKVMKDPIFLPCSCSICHIHIKDLYKKGGTSLMQCKSCSGEFPVPSEGFRVNKRFKSAIDNDDHLTEAEKQLKDSFGKSITKLAVLSNKLCTQEANLESLRVEHVAQIQRDIELHGEKLHSKIEEFSQTMLGHTNTFAHQFQDRIAFNANLIKEAKFNFAKETSLFQDFFRCPNVATAPILAIMHGHEKIYDKMQSLLDQSVALAKELLSVKFVSNLDLGVDSFGALNDVTQALVMPNL